MCAQPAVLDPARTLAIMWCTWVTCPSSTRSQQLRRASLHSQEQWKQADTALCSPHTPPHLSSGHTGSGGTELGVAVEAKVFNTAVVR